MDLDISLHVMRAPSQAVQYANDFVGHGSTPRKVQEVAQALIDMDRQAARLLDEIEQLKVVLRRGR